MRKYLFKTGSIILLTLGLINSAHARSAPDSIRLNQLGFYPGGPKTAIILTGKQETFTIETADHKTVFSGTLKRSVKPDFSGKATWIADLTPFNQTGVYTLTISGGGRSYPFSIEPDVHRQLAKAAIKAFYFQRASIALPEKYAGKWHRPAGHPDTAVFIHPSAASDSRPAGTIISSPGGWYDAGDYNKYIVNSGITMGTLLSLYEDLPAYMRTVDLNIPESGNQLPDVLNEILWNLRWMLTMQDPHDGGVYHKLTNADFDGMIMPDKATSKRYVVQKGTAASLEFAAVMAQSARIFKKFDKACPGLADSCLNADPA